MRVLYLTDQIYLHGGIEKVLSQKANWLAEVAGDEVYIICHSQQQKKPCYPFSDKIKLLDLGVNYNINKSYFSIENIEKVFIHKNLLTEKIKQIKPDVVISCSFGPDLFFIPGIEKHIPKIKEYHATRYFSSKEKGLKKTLMDISLRNAEKQYHRLVLLNEDEVEFYESNNITIIPNPTDNEERVCSLTSKKIIAAGRISHQKNFEELIAIWKNIHPQYADWQIHIYGDDYAGRKERIAAEIHKNGFENNIIFKGVSSDLKDTFIDYSIYVMPSIHETFPMVLLEALSVGLPIVSYKCPTGPDRIVTDNEDGYIVPYRDTNVFSEKLAKLMGDDALRKKMGSQAKTNAKRFSIDVIMQQWKNLFSQLTNKK